MQDKELLRKLHKEPEVGMELMKAVKSLGEPDCEIIVRKFYLLQSSKEIADKLADEEFGFDIHDKSYLEKYDGDSLLWKVSFEEFYIGGYTEVKGGIIVFGCTPTWSSEQVTYSWIAKVDDKGSTLWKQKLRNGFEDEYVADVIENGDIPKIKKEAGQS